MASNNLAPTGFAVGRNIRSAAGNYAALPYFILNGYGTNIMVGDPVSIASNGTVTAVSGTVTSLRVNPRMRPARGASRAFPYKVPKTSPASIHSPISRCVSKRPACGA